MKQSSNNEINDTGIRSNNARRKLLKGTIAGGAAIGTGLMADKWAKPVVNSVLMPAHAQTSLIGPSSGTGQIVQCNDPQQAGGDAPDRRSVDLGSNSGTFEFSYQTFSIQDQIIVSHEGQTLFDTGCVGASGTESLTYSGNSSLVTVQVIPNCSGPTTGTAWNWSINCPSAPE